MKINISNEKLADFCRRNHIRRLSFFGSVLRDDFGPTSDIDVLVEFESGCTPGFLRLSLIEEELSFLMENRKVDLVTEKSLNPRIRNRVIAECEVGYAA
jgi:hypothetical protein